MEIIDTAENIKLINKWRIWAYFSSFLNLFLVILIQIFLIFEKNNLDKSQLVTACFFYSMYSSYILTSIGISNLLLTSLLFYYFKKYKVIVVINSIAFLFFLFYKIN